MHRMIKLGLSIDDNEEEEDSEALEESGDSTEASKMEEVDEILFSSKLRADT